MKKLKTILPKDPKDLGRVIEGELMEGISYFKLKIDGTACMLKDGKPYCRYDAKLFKKNKGKVVTYSKEEVKSKLPEGALACQEPDDKSGHWPHWIPCLEDNPQHKHIWEGFHNTLGKIDGTYECIGPKIQGNPHNEVKHVWINHNSEALRFLVWGWRENPHKFFKNLFKNFHFEGLVAYNDQDEPIGKIRKSDFGYTDRNYTKASKLKTSC